MLAFIINILNILKNASKNFFIYNYFKKLK